MNLGRHYQFAAVAFWLLQFLTLSNLDRNAFTFEIPDSIVNQSLLAASNFYPPSPQSLEVEKSKLQSLLRSVEGFILSQPGWREYVKWNETQSIGIGVEQNDDVIRSIQRRWFHTSQATDNLQFFDVYQQLKRVVAVQQQLMHNETSASRTERLQELIKLVNEYRQSPSDGKRIEAVKKQNECETLGMTGELFRLLNRELVRPNLILRTPSSSLLTTSRSISETFPTSGVYNGLRTSGNGVIQASVYPQLRDSSSATEIELVLTGSVSSSSVGDSQDVRVQSSANSNVTASKPIRITGWGNVSFGQTSVSCPTTIRYNSITPKVRPRFQNEVRQRVNANKRSSEIQAQTETEEWIRKRMNSLITQDAFKDLINKTIHLRDELFNLPETTTTIQPQSSAVSITQSITCDNASFPGAGDPPMLPELSGNQSVSIHESLISLWMSKRHRGKQVPIGDIPNQLKSSASNAISSPIQTTDLSTDYAKFRAEAPVVARISADGKATIGIYFDEISIDQQLLKNYRIEVDYAPIIKDRKAFLQPTSKSQAYPISFNSENGKLSSRQITTCNMIERRIDKEFNTDLIELPTQEFLGPTSAPVTIHPTTVSTLSMNKGWIHLQN